MNFLQRFATSPVEEPPNTQQAHEDDEAARIRAMTTVLALSGLLGEQQPLPASVVVLGEQQAMPTSVSVSEKDSVVVWSEEINSSQKELLAEPMLSCPPYTDPSSVLIVDQSTLDCCSSVRSIDSSQASDASKVRFHETVSIVEIPSHRDMDADVVASIWTSFDEVNENGRRNALEYRADGRDWQQVKEEHEMVFYDGEYIHPFTWESLEAERQEQLIRLAWEEAQRLAAERVQREAKKKSSKSKRRRKNGQRPTPNRRTFPKSAASLTRFADT